jgi:phage shock protein E
MSKSAVIFFIVFTLITVTGCEAQQQKNDSVSTQQVASSDTAKAQHTFYVDVRTPAEFAAGSVDGAVNIPLNEVEARIGEFRNKGEIVVFCQSGNRSGQAKSILERNGIRNVTNGGSWEDVRDRK